MGANKYIERRTVRGVLSGLKRPASLWGPARWSKLARPAGAAHLAVLAKLSGLVCLFFWVAGLHPVNAQERASRLTVDQAVVAWPPGVVLPGRDPFGWREALVTHYRKQGFFRARIDSVAQEGQIVYVTRGPAALLGGLDIDLTKFEAESEDGPIPETLGDLIRTAHLSPGDTLSQAALDGAIRSLLIALSDRGRLRATARVEEVSPVEDVSPGEEGAFRLRIVIDPGPIVPINGLELEGATRTDTDRLERILNSPSDTYSSDRRAALTRDLRNLDVFAAVGEARIEVLPDSGAVLVVPVTESAPGSFDLALGYLPPAQGRTRGTVVGQGSIDLHNAFGAGRTFFVKLDRRPSSVSSVDVRAADPFVAGTPIGTALGFSAFQQDSTYSSTAWRASLGYRLIGNMRVGVRYSRESTRPGQAGLALVGGRQRIPRSNSGFWGVEFELIRVDDRRTPRRGIEASSLLERGRRTSTRTETNGNGEKLSVSRNTSVERMEFGVRTYISPGRRLTFVSGVDASLLNTEDPDESELFRLGGASSLRGYDEDRFRGTVVGRGLAELRAYTDATTYGFVFFDLGYVSRSASATGAARDGWHPGFGLGVRFPSAVGLMNLSYAINNEDALTNGRVHLGLSFGL